MARTKKPPAFQMYAKDALVGTMALTNEEFGAYMRLLLWSWDNGKIPSDFDRTRSIIGVGRIRCQKIWSVIKVKFEQADDGSYYNARLEEQRQDSQEFRAKASAAGKLGMQSRWGNERYLEPKRDKITNVINPLSSRYNDSITLRTAIGKEQDPEPDQQKEEGGVRTGEGVPGEGAEKGLVPIADSRPMHRSHSWCSGRLCVPRGLHQEFMGRLGASDAEKRLWKWYPTVLARYDGQALGDDVFAFWRAEFRGWVGEVRPHTAVGGKGAASKQGMTQALRKMVERGELQ